MCFGEKKRDEIRESDEKESRVRDFRECGNAGSGHPFRTPLGVWNDM